MADVALDPQNSNPKELFGQGVRAFVLQDYDTAVSAFSKASELLSEEHGSETHDSLGDVYLYYGKALLEISRKESGPLGDGVLKNVEEEAEEEDLEAEDEGEGDGKENGDATGEEEKTGGDKPAGEAENGEGEAAEVKNGEEQGEGKVEEAVDGEAGTSAENKEGGDAEEELTDLQVAWEVLELAKKIFTNRGVEGKKNLADTLIILGEVSLESGNFAPAIEDMKEGLEIQKTLYGNDSRTIAETCYKLGTAYATDAQIDLAIESFNSSLEYLRNKVESLKKDEEHKEANAEEIEELNALIPEVEEKVADMKNLKAEIAKKVTAQANETAAKTNGTSAAASSSKQVNDISHLVKRKRKEEDLKDEKPAKKPSP